jgi:Spy/CpxP family protein refolding chaperone
MSTILIKNGLYRGTQVSGMIFKLVKGFQTGAKGGYVTVKADGYFGPDLPDVVRVNVPSIEDIEFVTGETTIQPKVEVVAQETDEEVMNRIEERFEILHQMTRATISGDVRAMIVVGPPGVGKSYGVEFELEKSGLFDKISGKKIKYEVVKGAMTPIGLYCTLYRHSDANNVLVFDDCDSVFQDELALNILKAALDSGKKRKIHWNSDSAMLRREGVPDMFDFKGGAIFITNLKFDNIKSKKMQDHLEALQSRCHFLDLTLDTMRDKFLRIKQIFRQGQLFNDYDFTSEQGDEILAFMDANQNRLREMSLRMALKLADLTKVSKDNWKALAVSTCMKNS